MRQSSFHRSSSILILTAVVCCGWATPSTKVLWAAEGGGDPSSGTEACQPCKDRNMGITTKRTIGSPAALDKAIYAAEKVIEKLPYVANCIMSLNGQITINDGKMCCEEEKCKDPVDYVELGGGAKLDINIAFTPPMCSGGFDWGGNSPVHWRVFGYYQLGPKISLNPQVTVSLTGRISTCGDCVTVGIDVECPLKASVGASIKGQLELFEQGHWYSLEADAEIEVEGSVSSSINGNADYAWGKGCTKAGPLASHASLGSGELTGECKFTYDGWSFGFEKSFELWKGVEF